MEDQKPVSSGKNYGIQRVFKFGHPKKKENKNYVSTKTKLIEIEKEQKQSIMKIEFSLLNSFILLSNGQIYSRGKNEYLGRKGEIDYAKDKIYKEVQFVEDSQNPLNFEVKQKTIIYNISAGDNHVLALDNNYRIWGWGENKYSQVIPDNSESRIQFPVIIQMKKDANVAQIFAVQNSSMAICKMNKIFMWGCIKEGYLGNFGDKNKSKSSVDQIISRDRISAVIMDLIFKDSEDYTEAFTNARKIFNTKYNQTLKDNDDRKERLDIWNSKIKNLKTDIELRQNQRKTLFSSIHEKSNDKRIQMLQEILKNYEDKLESSSIRKDAQRKELVNIEDEMNQKNADLSNTMEEIDRVEDQIEQYNNEITELETKNQKLKDKVVIQVEENKGEKTKGKETMMEVKNKSEAKKDDKKQVSNIGKKIKYLENYRDSLMKTVQIMLCFVNEKGNERAQVSSNIAKLAEKEDKYLQARYTIEDMIQIIQDSISTTYSTGVEEGRSTLGEKSVVSTTGTSDKNKEKYSELLKYNEKLQKISFIYLTQAFPFKVIEDLLVFSNSEIISISKDIQTLKASSFGYEKTSLRILFEMIETKLELTKEQNMMIENIYVLLSNLKNADVREKFKGIRQNYLLCDNINTTSGDNTEKNDTIKNQDNSHLKDIEYLYKDIIIKTLRDAYTIPKESEELVLIDPKKMKAEEDKYFADRNENIEKLKKRDSYQIAEFRYEDMICFNSKKEEEKSLNSGWWPF